MLKVALDKRVIGGLQMDSDAEFFKTSFFGQMAGDSHQAGCVLPSLFPVSSKWFC